MNGGFLWRRLLCLALGCLGSNLQDWLGAVGKLDDLERFANMDPKPFVLIEASGDKIKNRGQGVVLSEDGLVISVGHASWLEEERAYSNRFRISFRGKKNGLPEGEVHRHTTRFSDREGTSFLETYYQAEQIRFEGSRFLDGADLGVFKIRGKGRFPRIEFFSQSQPDMEIGGWGLLSLTARDHVRAILGCWLNTVAQGDLPCPPNLWRPRLTWLALPSKIQR